MAEEITVTIIGTAGRKEDACKMDKDIYDKMVKASMYVIETHFKLKMETVTLVSGGAAWSDHVAVKLYNMNKVKDLILYLPCEWEQGKYRDTGERDWKVNPGRTSNYYHEQFSKKIGENTLEQIELAYKKGAKIITQYNGFHNRNSKVAQSDYVIAFTWGEDNEPKEGGTLFTWKLCNGYKVHLPLNLVKSF